MACVEVVEAVARTALVVTWLLEHMCERIDVLERLAPQH